MDIETYILVFSHRTFLLVKLGGFTAQATPKGRPFI
jgi:hypothetical protein